MGEPRIKRFLSNSQKNLLAVENVEQQPFDGQGGDDQDDGFEVIDKRVGESSSQGIGSIAEIDEFRCHVNQDGIEADDGEKDRPFFVSEDIDDQIKKGKKDKAPAADIYHKGTRPEILVDGEIRIPEFTQP